MTAPDSTPEPPQLGEYFIHTAWEGFASIAHRASGEIMHGRKPPMDEARQLYVGESDLAERLRAGSAPLVLWDVGLGAAANAMAAIHCYEEQSTQGTVRPLRIVSFENDLDPLRLALGFADRFPYLRHAAPRALLQDGCWQSEQHAGLSWELVEGAFPATIERAPGPPEVIFYDMFSPPTCGEAWRLETFRRIFAACDGRPAVLCTYTVSTASRAAMLAAGFWVARGRPTGPQEETTVALTPSAVLPRHALLDRRWLGKWERSTAKFPADVAPAGQAGFERLIVGHAQFA